MTSEVIMEFNVPPKVIESDPEDDIKQEPVVGMIKQEPSSSSAGGLDMDTDISQAWLPDGYSRIFRLYVFGPSGFWTMAPLRYAAKFGDVDIW